MLSYSIRTYEIAKRFIPRRVQLAVRTSFAIRKLKSCAHTWPVYEPAKGFPEGWGGWPEGKKFALVLTHDTDTQAGHDRSLELADLEKSFGFRSSFNFVARDYRVSPQVREELAAGGFEVGVHGAYHDSSLYHSRETFLKQAPIINQALREWNAVGFRSPCMYHNLEWIHDLDIEYDSSTFDIDPFEPQPEGVHTIFPFYVLGAERRGYVELPYTLPQDFTLFILLRRQTIDIWKKKLEWIVQNGGMALLNAHPDYMTFSGRKSTYSEYKADLYAQFLEHVKSVYRDQFWHPLPREITRFWAARSEAGILRAKPSGVVFNPGANHNLLKAPDTERPGDGIQPVSDACARSAPAVESKGPLNVCMLAYTFYKTDNRVRRYAEALAERGDNVDVIALRQEGTPSFEIIKGVNVYRIQERVRNERASLSYLFRLLRFLLNSAAFVSKMRMRRQYDLVHVHSVPDFEVFAALVPKIFGARVILDIHDIVPEFYVSKFNVSQNSFVYKALKLLEKLSVRFADHVIIANHIWERTLLERCVNEEDCTTFLNYPDPSIFFCRSHACRNGKPLFMYPGSLNRHQGLDIALKAFSIASQKLSGAQFHIYGGGPEEGALRNLVEDLGLGESVLFHGFLPLDQIAEKMADATVAVVPKRNDPFGGDAFSTKVFEFMALGVPVILSRTRIDDFYFNDSVVHFFQPENCEELAGSLVSLASDENRRQALVKNALKFVEGFCWDKKKQDYYHLIDELLA